MSVHIILGLFVILLDICSCLRAPNKHELFPVSNKQVFIEKVSTTLSTLGALCVFPTLVSAQSSGLITDLSVAFEGKQTPVKDLLGSKATLIVNVASQCALTPQYEELVELYKLYSSQGFQILAFPCNQFGNQEPAEESKIRSDMLNRFGATFPILDKIDVNGARESPLYTRLKSVPDIGVSKIGKISWNFEKFLIDSSGAPVRRYKPGVLPLELKGDIEALLAGKEVPPRKRATLNDY